MRTKLLTVVGLSIVSGVVLAGCAQPAAEEDLGNLDVVGDTNVLDAISDELDNVDVIIADAKNLFFDAGYYSFTYSETPMDKAMMGQTTAEGFISFRDDGTCAFEATGTQSYVDGDVTFTFVKDFDNTATLRYDGEDFDRVDPAEYEAVLGLTLPPVASYPRSPDYAGFCGVQSLAEYVDRAERAPGTGLLNAEKANAFVEKQRSSYYDNMFQVLGINDYTPEAAREILERTYVGAEIMPIWDGILNYGADIETGVVTISNGILGETNYAEMVMTPNELTSQERQLEYAQQYMETWKTQLDFYLEVYGSGDEFIKSKDL